jgi:diacylglycerol kinase (ATP)
VSTGPLPASPRRITLLLNPTAGRGRAQRAGGIVERRLRAAGAEVTVLPAESMEQMSTFADEAVASAQRSAGEGIAHMVVAVGGDGTVHVVLQSVAGSGVPFGVVAAGSGDDAARAWGLPRADPDAAADVLLAGETAEMDLGLAVAADGASRWFATVVATGFDAKVSERAHTLDAVPSALRYVASVAIELRALRPRRYRLTLDGVTSEIEAMLVAVANSRSYGGGMAVCPDALPDDGLLDVLVLGPLPRADFVRVFPRVYRGTHLSHPAVSVRRVRQARGDTVDVVAFVDGELLGPLPQAISVRSAALQVVGGHSST